MTNKTTHWDYIGIGFFSSLGAAFVSKILFMIVGITPIALFFDVSFAVAKGSTEVAIVEMIMLPLLYAPVFIRILSGKWMINNHWSVFGKMYGLALLVTFVVTGVSTVLGMMGVEWYYGLIALILANWGLCVPLSTKWVTENNID